MRKPLRRLLCALIALLLPVCLCVWAFALPPQYQDTWLGGLALKTDALRDTPDHRVVVIGGSGVAFALRSDLMSADLPGYTVVNLGLYAGLGTLCMLDLAEPELHPGDLVIFAPELSAQTLSDYFNAEAMWQAADGRFDLLTRLHPNDRAGLWAAFPGFAASKARYALSGHAPQGDGIYRRSAFTALGDVTGAGRLVNTMPLGFDPDVPIRFDPALISPTFAQRVRVFAGRCAGRGIDFALAFCPANAAAITPAELDRTDAFLAVLREATGCEVLNTPEDAILPSGWFFDTNYHLNAAGAVHYTATLTRLVQARLGLPVGLSFDLPDMPAAVEEVILSGDNSDANCFTWAEAEGGLRLTGLTDAGRARTTLTVPTDIDGHPVRSFAAGVFAGNAILRMLTIPDSIRHLEDGSFDGCTALQTIRLNQPTPAQCTVGAGLLTGTAATVQVPAGRLSAYATDYFWSRHANRLREAPPEEATPSPTATPAATPATTAGSRYITYDPAGGQRKNGLMGALTQNPVDTHLRMNTLPGTAYLKREGHVLIGWREAETDALIGLGSRVGYRRGLTLSAVWAETSPAENFTWQMDDQAALVMGWLGTSDTCVLPAEVNGLPVRGILPGAFTNRTLTSLVLPPSLRAISPGAFSACDIGVLTLFDSLEAVSDAAFEGCAVKTLRIQAATSPVYSGSYYDTFADKFDWLLSIRDQRKLVLFSGSSGRYGYDTPALIEAFPGWQAANMGVYAYTNALPQLRLIQPLMQPGDVLISAPEFDALAEQFCTTNALDASFWAMMESNYDMAALLDLRDFSAVFDSLGEYLRLRSRLPGRSYTLSPASYDDDGNYYAFATYNIYGDFTLPRPNGDRDERLRHNIADYTVDSFPPEMIDRLNAVYQEFLSRGITVYFTYTPRNRSSLTEASTPAARAALHTLLTEHLSVPVISDIESNLLSGIYFWRIDSHPSTEGASIRTRLLVEDLRRVGFGK